MAGQISVIIPALNEEGHLPQTIDSARREAHEVIVVDGGSRDRTCETARRRGARVLGSNPGKATQMNTGAAAATGEMLLFLHADTLLPPGFSSEVREVLSRPGVSAGAFRLTIDSERHGVRLVQWVANLRSVWLQLPYGDQALFLHRQTFQRLGGFAALPIMEDYDLVRRAGRQGQVITSSSSVLTSGRRWDELGPLKTTLLNWSIVVAYRLGISPGRLAGWYRDRSRV